MERVMNLFAAAEDPADVESRESVEDGTMSETSNDAEVDTIVGRIYNYDYAVKLLTLSKQMRTLPMTIL